MILVLEDDPDIAEIVCEVLAMAGYAVTVVPSEAALRRHLADDPVTLVLCDLRLGSHWDGLAMIPLTRCARGRRLPVVAMSGAGDEALEMAAHAGASATLSKPFAPQVLVALVTGLLAAQPEAL